MSKKQPNNNEPNNETGDKYDRVSKFQKLIFYLTAKIVKAAI